MPTSNDADRTLFIGSYAGRVSTLHFSPISHTLTLVHATDKAGTAPTWLAFHPQTERVLLASDEAAGEITPFEVAPSGELRKLGKAINVGGLGTVSVDFSPEGRSACAANYGGASLATLAVQPNGIPWAPSLACHPFVIEQPGPDADRQNASYPHQAMYDPTGHFIFCTDLGADLIRIFTSSPSSGNGQAEPHTLIEVERGSGPRHLAFLQPPHPSPSTLRPGRPDRRPASHLYVVCELSNTILVYALTYGEDNKSISLDLLQTTPTFFPPSAPPEGYIALASELAIHTQQGLLYAGNRWRNQSTGGSQEEDQVAVYAIDDEKRTLTPLRMHSLGAKNVRHFELSPCGEWLAVAGQGSGVVKIFATQGWRELASLEAEEVAVVRWWAK